MPDAPIIDLTNLRMIADGDEAFMRELIDIYAEDAVEQIKHLRKAVGVGDAPLVERYAHSLKGSSANIGAESMREIALAMEQRANGGDLSGFETEIDSLALTL